MQKKICYNASRQNEINIPTGKKRKPHEVGSHGVFYSVKWLRLLG